MDSDIKNALYGKGADIVRFVDISELSKKQTQGFKKAIVFYMVLSKEFINAMHCNLQLEQDEFVKKEHRCDELADWIANYIQQEGYNSYSQSEENHWLNGNYDENTKTSILPHKTIARLAGLGFIGKNNLLVTKDYGCAISMGTVLTDAPISAESYSLISSKCAQCDTCQKICPTNAIHGNEWTQSGGRELIIDVFKCGSCKLKCMTSCPWTLKYARAVNNG